MSTLRGFPTFVPPEGSALIRGHGFEHFPNFFSCRGTSRFDLQHPNGTMYLAESDLGMFLEGYRDSTDFTDADALMLGMSTFRIERQLLLADCTRHEATEFGIPDWIHDSPESEYDRTQAWARAFHEEEYDGIRYWSRFASHHGLGLRNMALFGPCGQAPGLPENMNRITPAVVDQARALGLRVSFNGDRPIREIIVPDRSRMDG